MCAKERIGPGEGDVARERLLERDDGKCAWKEPGGGGSRREGHSNYQDRNFRGSYQATTRREAFMLRFGSSRRENVVAPLDVRQTSFRRSRYSSTPT